MSILTHIKQSVHNSNSHEAHLLMDIYNNKVRLSHIILHFKSELDWRFSLTNDDKFW